MSTGPPEPKKFAVKFKAVPSVLDDLKRKIREAVGKNRPAR